MNKAQLGYIEVQESLLERFWEMNKEFIPLDIEMPLNYGVYKYLCYSKYFRILKEGESIPTYTTDWKCEENGVVHFLKVTEVKK